MGESPLIFEQVVAHLFQAKHNVTLHCSGTARGVQFDGYREIHIGNFLSPIKIGIECKRWNKPVNRDEVSAFSMDVRHCNLHRGIMISFSGFQAGAIERAKVENIDLFEFRPCSLKDFKRELNVINYVPINPGHWRVRIEWQMSQKEKDALEELSLNVEGWNFHDAYIIADNGTKRVKLGVIATNLIETEVFSKGKIEGTIHIDWSSRNVSLQITNTDIGPRIHSVLISYKFPEFQRHITEFEPSNWYIMKDVVGNFRGLIPLSDVQEIERLFRKKLE